MIFVDIRVFPCFYGLAAAVIAGTRCYSKVYSLLEAVEDIILN